MAVGGAKNCGQERAGGVNVFLVMVVVMVDGEERKEQKEKRESEETVWD